FEAHVRTAKRISDSGSRPFDFAILAGDITDTSQKNELDWVLTILNGGVVDPDSGIDNDPDPGPGNDYNDPFLSDSLNTPWYPALGNHDVLYIGGFGVNNDLIREAAVDDHLFTRTIFNLFRWHGYVAGDTLDGDIVLSPFIITPPDNDRVPLNQAELLQTFHDAGGEPQGHGFTQNDVAAGKGYYSVYPVPGKPIKMLVLDTTDSTLSNMTIAFQGSMDKEQFGWLEQELTLADDNRELVIVVSHHRLEDFHIQSPVLPFKLRCLLSSYENVILHLAGHGHKNTKELQRSIFNDHGYWELMTASTGDFPMQSRIIELVDEGNG
ncbi:MAG: hypothetical protein GY850_21505, partial [bacterium]|nr:hypothetical protein [bacterium]